MPRGMVPRQPARSGRQDKVNVARTLLSAKSAQKQSLAVKDARARKSARLSRGKASAAAAKGRSNASGKPAGSIKGYIPVAPERVAEILKRLAQMYPDVTCALTHAS